jgi:serine/threonine-protein kinase
MRVDSRKVRECLAKVLASSSFAGAARMQQFLRFVVEETLEGRAGEIKETVVAMRVFGRRGDFDSRSDSVVRVQATNLRKRLREYYQVEGVGDGVVIELPPGSYAPVFRSVTGARALDARRKKRKWLLPAIGLAIAAALALWTYGWLERNSSTPVAVLPFASHDAGPESDYLAEGVAEDLMTALARWPDLRVVARDSAFQFRGKNLGAREIGRELGARVLVEGSIRGTRDRLTVTAQLVDSGSGFALWSERWEGPADEVALFEERIAVGVRQALGKTPGGREAGAAAAPIRPPLPAAQEAYWRGRILLSKPIDAQAGSIPLLEQAVAADPQYAPAHAALATAYTMALYHGSISPRDEPLKKARREGARAIELDPASSEAYASLAMIAFAFDHDWAAAERGFEKALELNPSDARGHLQYSMGLTTRGRFREAIAHAERTRVLDPLSFAATNYLAIALYCGGRYGESVTAARQALAADPGYSIAHVAIGRGLAMEGSFPQALAEFDLATQKYGRQPWILGRMGYTMARAGRTAQARAIIEELGGIEGLGVHSAFVYAGLGDRQRSLDALELAFRQGSVDLDFMAVDPMLAGLRAEPRFLALKRRMGL